MMWDIAVEGQEGTLSKLYPLEFEEYVRCIPMYEGRANTNGRKRWVYLNIMYYKRVFHIVLHITSILNTFDLEMDLHRFFRRLRLKVKFSETKIPDATRIEPDKNPKLLSAANLGLRTKSLFGPPHGSHALEAFVCFVSKSFSDLCTDVDCGLLHYPPNLSAMDRQALRSLQEDRSLIIKHALNADTGDNLRILLYTLNYLEAKQITSANLSLHKFSNLGVLDTKTCEYLTKSHPITPVFYILPKIHKKLERPPGRPKVASREDLYSSIPHAQGIESVQKLMSTSGMDPDQTDLRLELFSIALTKK
ncbi:unnamed protein product [Ranitomeya imitator]|uniref:Uncharacterized protein n=1 Tax=Ranitomeya imitator TaxID=111125 RepID=A0ABN9LPM5_9NEOB|nr:unnamed protein product [Ranitomeya imitator]